MIIKSRAEKICSGVVSWINDRMLQNIFRDSVFISPLPYAIGNFSEEVRYALIQQEIENKKLFILIPKLWTESFKYKICNRDLFCICEEYTKSQYNPFFYHSVTSVYNIYFSLVRILYLYLIKKRNSKSDKQDIGINNLYSFPRIGISIMWQVLEQKKYENIACGKSIRSFNNSFKTYIEKKTLNAGREIKNTFENDKSIWVIHARSNAYYNDGNRRNRNMDITTYEQGIITLLEKYNMNVCLIGDPNNINIKHANFRNIPNTYTGIEQRFIELNMIEQCTVYLGTQSGPLDLALLLGKNIICINAIDMSNFGIDISKKARSWYALKPAKRKSEIKNSVVDLNDEGMATIFKYCHTSEYIDELINCYLGSDEETMNKKLKLLSQEVLEENSLRLISKWKRKATLAKTKAAKLYYDDETNRLNSKKNMSHIKSTKCFYS